MSEVENTTVEGLTVEDSTVEGGGGGPTPPPPVGTTQFLAEWTGLNAATSYTEESANAAAASFNGAGTQIDTGQFVSAPSSLLVTTTGTVSFPDLAAYDLTDEDFLLETSFRVPAAPGNGAFRYIMNQTITVPTNERAWNIAFANPPTSLLRFFYNLVAVDRPLVVSANTWYKVTIQRVSDALTISVDDVQLGAAVDLTGITIASSPQPLRFGGLWNGSAMINPLDGWIDDTQIVIG